MMVYLLLQPFPAAAWKYVQWHSLGINIVVMDPIGNSSMPGKWNSATLVHFFGRSFHT